MADTKAIRLDSTQQAAVDDNSSAILLLASAGSGKTEVVAQRVERILTTESTSRVLALSYTVKAAAELHERFEARLGSLNQRVRTDTMHGFAHGILRKNGSWVGLPIEPDLYQRDDDRIELLGSWLASTGQHYDPEPLKRILAQVDQTRATRSPDTEDVLAWRSALAAVGAIDYASMLELSTELLRMPSFRRQFLRDFTHLFVDEAQNMTPAQYELLTTLIGPIEAPDIEVMLVGDDKQSIVGFSGGDATLLDKFTTDYSAKALHLPNNYRSATKIVELGELVSAQLGNAPKPTRPTYPATGSVQMSVERDEQSEARAVADWVQRLLAKGLEPDTLAEGESPAVEPEQIAVLGRSASAITGVEQELARRSLSTAKAIPVDDWLVSLPGRVVLELLSLRQANASSASLQLQRLLQTQDSLSSPEELAAHLSTREDGLGPLAEICLFDDLAMLISAIETLDLPGYDYWDSDRTLLQSAWSTFKAQTDVPSRTWASFRIYVYRVQRTSDLTDGVRLLTIHKSQGSEFKAIALVGLNEGQLPDFRANTTTEREAELRAFYVAITRPSRALLLSRAESRRTRYGSRRTDPSPFLSFLDGHTGQVI